MQKEESRFADSTLMEGMISFRAVIRGMENGVSDRQIIRVFYDRTKEKQLGGHLSYIRAMHYQYGFEIVPADPGEIDALATGGSHGGILTLCSDRTIPALTADKIKPHGFYVMIEGIEDPYNFGYAMRSLYAAGADGIILSERNWLSAAGVVCRSSAGASERLNVYIATDSFINDFKNKNYKIVCADLKNSVSVYDANLKKPIFLIVGGEKRGISSALLKEADQIVRIDYGRDFDAALSAASAATILAFEIFRNNK